jgi:hypothetical protein
MACIPTGISSMPVAFHPSEEAVVRTVPTPAKGSSTAFVGVSSHASRQYRTRVEENASL